MSNRVSFGTLTSNVVRKSTTDKFATNVIRKNTPDITSLYKKYQKQKQEGWSEDAALELVKKAAESLKRNESKDAEIGQNENISAQEVNENIEKADYEINHNKFGELTGINEYYYRPAERVTSTIEYADDTKENQNTFFASEMEEIRESVEKAQFEAENDN